MVIVEYPRNIDCFSRGDIASWAKNNNLGFVIELHQNAASPSALGYESWVRQGSFLGSATKDLHNLFIKKGFVNRGIKSTTSLANALRIGTTGIGYVLLEIGFITNNNDMSLYDTLVKSSLGAEIFKLLESAGINKLGVIYGHGGYDPGAVNKGLGLTERENVRRLNIKKELVEEMASLEEIKKIIKDYLLLGFGQGAEKYGEVPHAKLRQSGKFLDELDPNGNYDGFTNRGMLFKVMYLLRKNILFILKPSYLRTSEETQKADKELWNGLAYKNLQDLNNSGLEITEGRLEDVTTRAEVFTLLNKVVGRIERVEEKIKELEKKV